MPPAHSSVVDRLRNRVPWRVAAVTLASLALLSSACGKSDASGSSAGSTSTILNQDTVHDHETIDVTAVDFNFENLPKTIKAGTQLTLTNAATSELHELVAIRLPDGENRPISVLLELPQEELGVLLQAVPATVLLAAPGGPQIDAVGDGTLTEPGRYVIMCSIPTGVEPAVYLAAAAASKGGPPEVEGGPPHFVQGMAADLIVE